MSSAAWLRHFGLSASPFSPVNPGRVSRRAVRSTGVAGMAVTIRSGPAR